jgi:hypothetical protein
MIHLQKESTELDFWNLNYIKITQTCIFKFEYFELVESQILLLHCVPYVTRIP